MKDSIDEDRGGPPRRRAALFITCLSDLFFPRVALATAEVLRRLGVEVEFPEGQTCCGQPAFNSGYRREAQAVAGHFLDVFEEYEYVVAPSGSCVSMVREHYPHLFDDQPAQKERALALAERTFELCQFITRVLGVESTGARFPHSVVYHDSCHSLRSLGLREEPRRLLRAVDGIDLRDLPESETCCGFGGLFSVKYPEISLTMCADKIARIEATGAEFVVATDASCLMHIGGALEKKGSKVLTMHLAEVLAGGR